tara:strand:+ start:265 stop:477 length:213 start_codon:yes stop_codon:yes gene_type:complete
MGTKTKIVARNPNPYGLLSTVPQNLANISISVSYKNVWFFVFKITIIHAKLTYPFSKRFEKSTMFFVLFM